MYKYIEYLYYQGYVFVCLFNDMYSVFGQYVSLLCIIIGQYFWDIKLVEFVMAQFGEVEIIDVVVLLKNIKLEYCGKI